MRILTAIAMMSICSPAMADGPAKFSELLSNLDGSTASFSGRVGVLSEGSRTIMLTTRDARFFADTAVNLEDLNRIIECGEVSRHDEATGCPATGSLVVVLSGSDITVVISEIVFD